MTTHKRHQARVVVSGKMDESEYRSAHDWIRRRLGRPMECWHCGDNTKKMYAWANKSGEYKKEEADWLRLCHKCHQKMDGYGWKKGDGAHFVKLTETQVINILHCRGAIKNQELASLYKVHTVTIGDILNGKTWKSVSGIEGYGKSYTQEQMDAKDKEIATLREKIRAYETLSKKEEG